MVRGDWFVLRTDGRHTLTIASSLIAGGFDVWTPAETHQGSERLVPMTATYIFARACHLTDLTDLSETPAKGFRDFSVFHCNGRLARIADCELEPLRTAENRMAPKAKQRVYEAGEMVMVPDGAWGGMFGVVEYGDRRFTTVCFLGKVLAKIATSLLRPFAVRGEQIGAAAQAA